MKKILIIGGAGYIGSVLIESFLKNKYQVVSVDNYLYGKNNSLNGFIKNKNFISIRSEFSNIKLIDELINQGYNRIIFLAALVGDPITKKYPELTKKIMLNDTIKLINHCEKKRIKNFFYVSTCSNYGLDKTNKLLKENSKLRPLSLYAKCKVFIEKFLIKKKINFTILRFSTAFGLSYRMRFDLTINEFVKEIFYKKKLLIYDPDTYRPYLHTKDFARLFLLLLTTKKKINKKIYNVGSTKNNYTKREIFKKIDNKIKCKKILIKEKGQDPRNYRVSFEKIKKELGFKAKYSVDYAIKEIIKYLKTNDCKRKKFSDFGNYLIKNELHR